MALSLSTISHGRQYRAGTGTSALPLSLSSNLASVATTLQASTKQRPASSSSYTVMAWFLVCMRMAASAHPVYLLNSSRVHVVPLCVGGGGRGGAEPPAAGVVVVVHCKEPRAIERSIQVKESEVPGTGRHGACASPLRLGRNQNLTEWWWLLATCQNLFPLGDYDRVN